ncbi:MAG: heavy metal translocating P-type ATPase metal-binding domain-containing protein [Bacteroidetes bacterium]|nr:heavy metal translocating P-type ATPase metal-binding domain-containing protein [Bacteroidota bacterium]
MNNNISAVETVCQHCGAEASGYPVSADGLQFCCNGCETVFHILKDHNLCDYYRFEAHPGVRKAKVELPSDDELQVIATEFTTYRDDQRQLCTLEIPEMHCASCVWLLEKLPALLQGVYSARVDFVKKKLDVAFNPAITGFPALVRVLDSLGYTPSLIPGAARSDAKAKGRTILKLAVAGFAFGNIMLFSFPEYLGLTDAAFKFLFSWLNVALSLPVVFFSAGHYFSKSLKSLKAREVSVDVPLALGLSALWLRSVYEVISATGPGYFDSLTGLVFFLLIGTWLQERTWEAIRFDRSAERFFPLSALRVKDGKTHAVRVFDLIPGDRVQVHHGTLIPGDGILMSHSALVDYSYVTGESTPVYKVAGEMLYAGGRSVQGMLEFEVVRPFTESRLQQMWSNASEKGRPASRISRFASQVSIWFTLGTLSLALITLLLWWPVNPSKALFAATAVLMVACPCALAIASPFAFSNASRILGRRGFFLRNPDIVETLASVNHLVFDKTGTLTDPNEASLEWTGPVPDQSLKSLIRSAAIASTHPVSRVLAAACSAAPLVNPELFEEHSGQGIRMVHGGQELRIGRKDWALKLPSREAEPMHERAETYISLNGRVVATFITHNRLRKGAAEMLEQFKPVYRMSLLSGDSPKDHAYLEEQVPGVFDSMQFRQDPSMKVEALRQLESKGDKVMMLGDGLNDAGALKAGHAGIVLAQDMTQFTPASSGILLQESLEQLPRLMRFARNTARAGRESFYISLLYNAVGLYFAATAQLSPLFAAVLMPVSSISVALFAVWRTRRFAKKEDLL